MKSDLKQSTPALRYLGFLTQSYVMLLLFSQIFHGHFMHFWGYDQDAGKLLLCVTFLLISSITEIYGYQQARRALWCGGLFNLLLALYGQLITHLPSPSYAAHNPLFNALLSLNISPFFIFSILGASFISLYFMAQWKIKYPKLFMGYRLFFCAWIGITGQTLFLNVVLRQPIIGWDYFDMTGILLLFLPWAVGITQKLKQWEHLDIYDKRTHFNPLRWRVHYTFEDNQCDKFHTTYRGFDG